MKQNKIYILIPVYNVEQYLDACMNSILSQDYSEYEIILVNDGSKDSSGEICDRYAAENPRVHVIHKVNGGQISARLAAIDYVRLNCEYENTYCIFVDSDDELKPCALQAINEKIASSGCDMLIYGYERFDDSGVSYTTLEEKTKEKLIDDMGELFREAVIEHYYNSLCRKAVRTEMLFCEMPEHTKNIRMGEDLLQNLEIYKQNPHTLIVPDIFYRYRKNPTSMTQTFKLKLFTDELLSRYYTIKTLEELNIWSKNDFDRYISQSISVVSWTIRQILEKSPFKEAVYNLKQIYENAFVKEYCLERICGKSNIWLRNFSKKRFRKLLLLHKISKIKNLLRRK